MESICLKVLEARMGVLTNSPALVDPKMFFWLDTNFRAVERIPYEEPLSAAMVIRDGEYGPGFEVKGRTLHLSGNFSRWSAEDVDPRHSLFGSLGIFSSWVLRTLEEVHDIISLHAACLVKGHTLLLVPGGAGSGKTVFILSALHLGWRLFGSEFAHVRVSGGVEFLGGAVRDTLRTETVRLHFPEWDRILKSAAVKETGGKVAVDLSGFSHRDEVIRDPEIVIVFPRIEERGGTIAADDIEEEEVLLRSLFQAASEKIGCSLLMYGRMAVPGLDTAESAHRRLDRLKVLFRSGAVKRCLRWISGAGDVHRFFDGM